MIDLRALLFVPALVGSAICAFVFLTFAAHYYLTVLESTAAGAKEVTWLGEGLTDMFGKPFYLAWLLCLWLGPAHIIGRSLASSTQLAWVGLAVPVLVAWLLYPVSQLSSLGASSLWVPLHPQAVARLVQKPAMALGFFVLTLPVFALGGIAFKWAFLTSGEWSLLFAGVPLLVLAMFLYARLLGRLAFALMFTRDLFKRKKKKKPKKEAPAAGADAEPAAPAVVQPDELPPITTPDGELAGYNVLIADDPPRPRKRVRAEMAEEGPEPPPAPNRTQRKPTGSAHPLDRARTWTDEDEDATPYGVNASEVRAEERVPEAVLKPTAEAMALLDRRDAPKPPKRVWTAELFVFFGQPATISAMMILCGAGVLAGAMVRVARQFNPVAGG
ncbi:MAG: hypothetical protein J0I06_06925 [Planctomycetes bacterium]|nr:hypothetical protein [Planctomycetota bacterium]